MSIEVSDEMVGAFLVALHERDVWLDSSLLTREDVRAALTAALPMIEEKVRKEMQKRLDIAEAQVARPTYTERLGTGRGYTRVVPIRRNTP